MIIEDLFDDIKTIVEAFDIRIRPVGRTLELTRDGLCYDVFEDEVDCSDDITWHLCKAVEYLNLNGRMEFADNPNRISSAGLWDYIYDKLNGDSTHWDKVFPPVKGTDATLCVVDEIHGETDDIIGALWAEEPNTLTLGSVEGVKWTIRDDSFHELRLDDEYECRTTEVVDAFIEYFKQSMSEIVNAKGWVGLPQKVEAVCRDLTGVINSIADISGPSDLWIDPESGPSMVQQTIGSGISTPRPETGYDDQSGEEYELNDEELRLWHLKNTR